MIWGPFVDKLKLHSCLSDVDLTVMLTKRVIKTVQTCFCPLGLLLPTTVHARIFLQGLWKEKLDWDTRVLDGSVESLKELILDLRIIVGFNFPRQLKDMTTSCQLHAFTGLSNISQVPTVLFRTQQIFRDHN